MASFALQNQTPTLDLGADTKICKNSVEKLAHPGFQTYRWQDGSLGSRYTAFGAGKYWVDAFDACGFKQTDTIYVFLDTLNALQLPDEMSFCPGASINLTVSGFPNTTGRQPIRWIVPIVLR